MADSEADPAVDSSASPGGGGYIKLGKGEELRHVERDVIIPKIMKENAMRLCSEYVQAFEDCARGRFLSVVWACRQHNEKMQNCLQGYYRDEAFFNDCKEQFLKQREEYRQTGVRQKSRRSQPS